MPFYLFYTIRDAKPNSTTTVDIPIAITTPAAAFSAAVNAMAALLAPLVTGGLVNAGIKLQVDVPNGTMNGTPAAISDVQEKGEFSFITVNGFPMRRNIPTFNEALMVPNSNQIDTTDADVAAFITAMTTGFTAGGSTITPVDSRDEDLVSLDYAVENWGRRRR